jgi:hypothetical protein
LKQSTANTQGPGTVVDAREVSHAQTVQVTAGDWLSAQGRIAAIEGDEYVAQRIIEAPGRTQPDNVSVVQHGRVGDREDEEANLAGLGIGGRSMYMCVLDTGGEAPLPLTRWPPGTGTAWPGFVP